MAVRQGQVVGASQVRAVDEFVRNLAARHVKAVDGPLPAWAEERLARDLGHPGIQALDGWDLTALTPFEAAVHKVVVSIPRGQVRPYAWVAREAGHPRAYRAAGSVLGRTPFGDLLPWYRVGLALPWGGSRQKLGGKAKRQEREGVDLGRLDQLLGREGRLFADPATGRCCLPTCPAIPLRRARAVRGERAAVEAGFWPCSTCRPFLEPIFPPAER